VAYPFLLFSFMGYVGSGRPFWLLGHFFRLITASGKVAMPAAIFFIFFFGKMAGTGGLFSPVSRVFAGFYNFFRLLLTTPLSPRLSLNWMALCHSRMEFDPFERVQFVEV
jgi:hypothetical protein